MNHDTLKQLVQALFEILADHFKDRPVIRAAIEALETFAVANLDRLLDLLRVRGILPAVALLVLAAGGASAGDADARAKAALALAVAGLGRSADVCDCGCAAGGACDCPACPAKRAAPGEAELYDQALSKGRPLVYFVGQPARPVAGCLSHACGSFPGVAGPAVVVGVPGGGVLWRAATLPGVPSESAIVAALRPAAPVVAGPPACAGCCAGCGCRR
jgi:hypothetical protein